MSPTPQIWSVLLTRRQKDAEDHGTICACTGALWEYAILLPAPTRGWLFYVLKSGLKHK